MWSRLRMSIWKVIHGWISSYRPHDCPFRTSRLPWSTGLYLILTMVSVDGYVWGGVFYQGDAAGLAPHLLQPRAR